MTTHEKPRPKLFLFKDGWTGGKLMRHPAGNLVRLADYRALEADNRRMVEALKKLHRRQDNLDTFDAATDEIVSEALDPAGVPYDPAILALVAAGNHLSYMAQTSGGTAGRDTGLIDAIDGWSNALHAAGYQKPEPVKEPTLMRLKKLYDCVDGAYKIDVFPVDEHTPAGKQQDCSDLADDGVEWVAQHGPGMAGDDFWGTVTWKLGAYYVVVHFAT